MTKTRILLAEDSRSAAQFIVGVLNSRGFDVTAAEDGQAAWEILDASDGEFETLVLDWEMPRMNGIDLLRKVKATPKFSQIPAVMATTFSDAASVKVGLAAGAYYYLTKPLVAEVLASVVQAAVGQYREYRLLREGVNRAERPFEFLDSGVFRIRAPDEGRMLANLLARACPNPESSVIGLQEIILNAIEHGNLGIGYAEKSMLLVQDSWLDEIERRLNTPAHRDKRVTVRFERTETAAEITIQDQGQGFDWKNYLDFDANRAFDNHGRGIAMARALGFGNVRYLGNGNTVVLTIDLPPSTTR